MPEDPDPKDDPKDDPQVDPDDDPKDEPFDEDRARAALGKKNSENKALRDRLKKAEAAQAELDELKKAQMSETEKVAAERDELKGKATESEMRAMRLEVALEAAPDGMSARDVAKYAKRLSGSTKEELAADAEEFFADFAGSQEDDDGDPGPGRRPKERLRGGGNPASEPEPDIRKIVDSIETGI